MMKLTTKSSFEGRVDKYLSDDENFIIFAANNYVNPFCFDNEEFLSDLLIPMNIRHNFIRYENTKNINERLVLNHLVCFFNVFKSPASLYILFYKIDKKHHNYLKTFLVFMDRNPDLTFYMNNKEVELDDIEVDEVLLSRLRNLR